MIRSYTLTLILKGPVLTRASAASAFGIDTPVARHADGTPYIPGSHVLGKLRHALRQLYPLVPDEQKVDALEAWFGQNSADGPGDPFMGADRQRPLYCGDLKAARRGNDDGQRTRIAIDQETGAAETGALQVLEVPYGIGETIAFEGTLHFLMPAKEAQKAEKLVVAVLNWITQMGGLRGIGFGQIETATLMPAKEAAVLEAPVGTPERISLVLEFSGPFCIAEKRAGANLFESTHIVPGGAVKGALARMMRVGAGSNSRDASDSGEVFPHLGAYFSALRLTHFLPVEKEGQRDRPLPLLKSLVYADGAIHDIALTEAPALIGGDIPCFQPDWKHHADQLAAEAVGQSIPSSQLRVRTAISEETLSASPEQLFAYRMTNVDAHVWVGELDFADVPADVRPHLWKELSTLFAGGIAPLGRGGAHAHVKYPQPVPAAPRPALPPKDIYVVSLRTPALLLGEDNSYETAIQSLFGGAFSLKRCFTKERQAGADFMANRYLAKGTYRPWLLTESGSVFVLRAQTADAVAKLQAVQESGLPLSDNVKAVYGLEGADADLWQSCPYIRQNGYGEICVDAPLHQSLKPDQAIVSAFAERRTA